MHYLLCLSKPRRPWSLGHLPLYGQRNGDTEWLIWGDPQLGNGRAGILLLFSFETGSVSQVGVTSMHHCARFLRCWELNSGLCAHQASTVPTELHPQFQNLDLNPSCNSALFSGYLTFLVFTEWGRKGQL